MRNAFCMDSCWALPFILWYDPRGGCWLHVTLVETFHSEYHTHVFVTGHSSMSDHVSVFYNKTKQPVETNRQIQLQLLVK